MDENKNKPPKPDHKLAPPLQGPSNVFKRWISSYQHCPPYQQLQQQQHPYSQVPQYFERSQTPYQQQFQQFPPTTFQIPFQQAFQTSFQQVYRPPNQVVHPLQQQQYVFNII